MNEQRDRMAPFLLGATLLFWGWQSQLLVPAMVMAIGLESARWVQTRWDLTDRDFNRIWTFCTLLLLAVTVYAFSANEGPAHFGGFFQHPDLRTERGVGTSTAKTMAQVIRWLPMVFFLFVAAQRFSTRAAIPLETISLILRWQWRRAKKLGYPMPARRSIDVSYIYVALCLMAASVHTADNTTYFWGMCALVAWALWPHRSRNLLVWAAALGLVITVGYFGQGGLGRMRLYLEGFNPQWLSGWPRRGSDPRQSKTALGQVGRVKTSTRIVIRLEPKDNARPPTLLREASYRDYRPERPPTWLAVPKEAFEPILSEKRDGVDTTYVLVPGKTNSSSVKIACYLDRPNGLLPLPEGSGRLENLQIYEMKKNVAGAVVVAGPGLVIFDAHYGPGETLDGPPDMRLDTAVRDPRESAALRQVITEFDMAGKSTKETLRKINAFFGNNFSYSMWQDRPIFRTTNETPLTRFLLRTRKGHCEYFATATVLLLRELGIPARYAVGYAVHEAAGTKYLVRQSDAHAWCVVWNKETNLWEDFDTTPASWVEAEGKRKSPFQAISDLWSDIMFQFSKLRWGQTHLRQYILWGLTPILAFLLYQIVSRGRRQRKNGRNGESVPDWPGLDSEFYELERKLGRKGIIRENSEPLRAWLRRAATAPELAAPLQQLLALHYRYRFDPRGLTGAEREILRSQARDCLSRLDSAQP